MASLRTPELEAKYKHDVAEGLLQGECRLCIATPIKEFELWKVIENDYPYNRIASVHHMIVPKRHVAEDGLNEAELAEYKKIANEYIHPTYEYIMETTHPHKTIPEHFHLHLIVLKD